MRDFSRITTHIVWQCLKRGGLPAMYRSIRAHPPVIDDPSGEFGSVFAQQGAQQQDERIAATMW